MGIKSRVEQYLGDEDFSFMDCESTGKCAIIYNKYGGKRVGLIGDSDVTLEYFFGCKRLGYSNLNLGIPRGF